MNYPYLCTEKQITEMQTTLFLIIGIALGALVGWFAAQSKQRTAEGEMRSLTKENERLSATLEQQNNDMEQLRKVADDARDARQAALTSLEVTRSRLLETTAQHEREVDALKCTHDRELTTLRQTHAVLVEAQERRHDEAVANLKANFDKTLADMQQSVKAATEDMLRSRQQEFSQTSQQSIAGIVGPLNETIAKMQTAMENYSKEQSDFGGMMKANVETIVRQTRAAQESAIELTTALKHDTKLQGDYGEAILDEILTKQGLTEGIHYDLQYTIRDEQGRAVKRADGSSRAADGTSMRPDVVLHLDNKRDVIIDSKLNLTDFINYANAKTPEERKRHLDRHVASIKSQVRLLSQKNYSHFHAKTAGRMDYVIMFVPISAAWWEALRHEPTLWREAMAQQVYIADEQTLFAAISIIRLTWTQIAQVENQKEVFGYAREMVERVGQFMKHHEAMGNALNSAVEAYTKAHKKLLPGGQSILKTADKLLQIGVEDSKKSPVAKYIAADGKGEEQN